MAKGNIFKLPSRPSIYLAVCGLLVCCLAPVCRAQPPAGLEKAVKRIVRAAHLPKGTRVGIYIRSLADDQVWYRVHENEYFIPASTMKLVTTSLALEYLGEDYHYATEIRADGAVTPEGELQGNLYLRGGGDPMLQPAHLVAMAHLLAAGIPQQLIPPIHAITGRVIMDDTFFPQAGSALGSGWEPEDLPWYYAAPISALSCSRNALAVTVHGMADGAPPRVTLTPETALFTLDKQAKTSAAAKTGALTVTHEGYNIGIAGKVAPGAEITELISVPEPPRLVEEVFTRALRASGIQVFGKELPGSLLAPTALVIHTSPALSEILRPFLKESINHVGEQLRVTMLALNGQETPLPQRYQALWAVYARRHGLPVDGIHPVDGSGLSRQNQVSPAAMVALLKFQTEQPTFPVLYEAIPIAGVDGTLAKRCLGTPAAGNVHAKTGTVRGVSTLVGYVTTPHGEMLTFAIMLNGPRNETAAERKLQDQLVCYLAGVE